MQKFAFLGLLSYVAFSIQSLAGAGFPLEAHPFVEPASLQFENLPPEGVFISPECLRAKGYSLILIEPGHDDSEQSRRSEARRDEDSRKKESLRPRIHEGHLNQVVAWLFYDSVMKSSRLSREQKRELSTMLRFTRYPGELVFGDYEVQAGYSADTQGTIDHGTTNRVDRVNYMMTHHRNFDPSQRNGWATTVSDVRDQTLLMSVHSNNSGGFYDDVDYSWLIVDPASSLNSVDYEVSAKIAESFERVLPDFLQEKPWDQGLDKLLKFDARDAFALSRTKIHPADRPLKLISRLVGTENTTKFLSESFFMTGKIGHLVHRELESSDRYKALRFSRGPATVAEYQVSDLYMLYAHALAAGLTQYLNCL